MEIWYICEAYTTKHCCACGILRVVGKSDVFVCKRTSEKQPECIRHGVVLGRDLKVLLCSIFRFLGGVLPFVLS